MNEIARLIEEASRANAAGSAAASQLVALGAEAVPAIVDALRGGAVKRAGALRDVLLAMKDPEVLPILLPLREDHAGPLRRTIFEVLGCTKDPRALQPLLDDLRSPRQRLLATAALGDLGDARAVPDLLQLSAELLCDDPEARSLEGLRASLVLEVAIALAKVGNHDLAPVVVRLAGRDTGVATRCKAVDALLFVVGPGVLQALVMALRGPELEIRETALQALSLLGVKEVIPELIALTHDPDQELAALAYSHLHDLVGEWPGENQFVETLRPGALERWWDQAQARFSRGVCYRLGKPLWLPTIFSLLHDPAERDTAREELLMITGVDFAGPAAIRASEWWEVSGARFEPGGLYKYGHRQDLSRIYHIHIWE